MHQIIKTMVKIPTKFD